MPYGGLNRAVPAKGLLAEKKEIIHCKHCCREKVGLIVMCTDWYNSTVNIIHFVM